MTDWIDFAVYAALLIALFVLQPRAQQRSIVPLLMDRNAEWVARHPDIVRGIAGIRWRLWLCYALGAISLGVLTSFQFGLWEAPVTQDGTVLPKWMWLRNLTMATTLAAVLIVGALCLQGYFALMRLVPIAARRQTTLERRSLDAFVPRWLQFLAFGLVAGNFVAWIAAAAWGTHSSPAFWLRALSMVVLSAVFFLATRAVVSRRANVMDRIFGPAYRPWEVRCVFSTQFIPPVIGALRLYEEVSGTLLVDTGRAMQLFIAGFLAYGLTRMAWMSPHRDGPASHRPVPTPVPSA